MKQRLRASKIENVRLVFLGSSLVLGPVVGWFLPAAVWRSAAGTLLLGDYALLCCFVAAVWVGIRRSPERAALAASVGLVSMLAARELAWRFSSRVLSMIYATAAVALTVVVVGSFVYELRRGRDLTTMLTPERVLALLVGIQITSWTLFSTVMHLVIG